MNDALKKHFETAREFTEARAPDWVKWCRERPPVIVKTQHAFIAEYVFVVSVSGFRASVVEKRFPGLAHALYDFHMPQLATLDRGRIRRIYMEKMLRNHAKAEAVLKGIVVLENPVTVEMMKEKLAAGEI